MESGKQPRDCSSHSELRIDLRRVRDLIQGGDSEVRRLAVICHAECQMLRQRLHPAEIEADTSGLQRAAHSFKNSAQLFGATQLADAALALELAVIERQFDKFSELIDSVDHWLDLFLQQLNELSPHS